MYNKLYSPYSTYNQICSISSYTVSAEHTPDNAGHFGGEG